MKLNLGSKNIRIDGFTNVDIYAHPNVDIVSDISDIALDDNSVDEIYASHCLEHFRRSKTDSVLSECRSRGRGSRRGRRRWGGRGSGRRGRRGGHGGEV